MEGIMKTNNQKIAFKKSMNYKYHREEKERENWKLRDKNQEARVARRETFLKNSMKIEVPLN